MKIQFCEPVSDTVEATREQVVEWLRQTIRRAIKPFLAEDADPVCEEWEDWAHAWMQGKPVWKSGEDAMEYLEGEQCLHGSMSMEFFRVQRAEALTRAAVIFDESVDNSMVYEQSRVLEILKWVVWGSHHQEVVERRQQYDDLIEIIKEQQMMTTEEFDKKFDDGEEDITNMLDMHNIGVFTSRNSHFPEEMQESLNQKESK